MRLPSGAVSRWVETGRGHLHVVVAGPPEAPPLILLHGWPEFWGGYVRLIPLLGADFRLIVPDLRGFGASAPAGPADGLETHVADQLTVLDALDVAAAGVVGHDVGAHIGQALALAAPARVRGLFFANCPYPGIGRRWVEEGQAGEIWYQSFNQQPWAAELVGQSRESCRLYVGHFLRHWAADPQAFDAVLEHWIDVFMAPGALEGGFAWYRANNAARLAQIERGPQPRDPITHPTRIFWGAHDPVLPARWAEGLSAYFTDLEVEVAENAGHFVFFEAAEAAASRIRAHFLGRASGY